ncbi:MAG: hypothetical protein KDB01_08235, partial [Planctomycetaceae bacterium]|nr:hypothetical protein [Planctomycetaceae bacterium]
MFATVQWKCRQPVAAGSLTYARFTVVVVLVCLLSWSATIEAQVRQIKLDASSLGVVPPRIGRYVLAKDRCWANKNSRHGGVDATFQFRLQEDQFKGIDIKLSWQESGTDGSAHDVEYGPQARFFNVDSRSAYFAASDTHQVHVYIRLNNGASLDQKSLDQIADDVISRTNRRALRLPVHVLAANFPKQFQGQTLGKVWTVESKNGDWSEINANYGTPRGGGANDAFHIELTLYRDLSGDYWPRDERLMEGTSKLVSSSRVLTAEYSLGGNRAASTDSVRKLAAEVMVRLEPLAAKRPDSASNQTAQSPPILTSPMTRQDDQPTGASRLSPAELVAVTAVLVSLLLGAGVTVNVTQSVVTSIVTSIQAGVDLTSQDIANLIGDAKKQTGETRTIVLSGDAAQDVRNRGVGANIHVSGSDR